MNPIARLRGGMAIAVLTACVAWPAAALAQVGAQPAARPDEPVAAPAPGMPDKLADDPLAMHAVRLRSDEHIVLDGTLSSPAWQRAPVYDRFVENEPHRDAKPLYATRVQVLFDESAVYVGVTALDDHPEQIRAPLVRHDNVIRTQDFVVLYIDAIGKRQSAQFFRVGASGSTGDGMHTAADDDEDFSPDFDFDAASARTGHGYTSVFRVPFASLRFSSDPRTTWRIMVARRMPRDQAYMWVSVSVPTDAPSFISAMQPLQGIELPQQHSFLTVRPSVTARHTSDTEPGQDKHSADGVQGSLDVKWRASPELVIDGTLKPDFSQVALDVPQLSGNTDFALYLPEKRPFFFESSDLLHSPTEALYTRSFTAPRWGVRSTWRDASLSGTAFVIDARAAARPSCPTPTAPTRRCNRARARCPRACTPTSTTPRSSSWAACWRRAATRTAAAPTPCWARTSPGRSTTPGACAASGCTRTPPRSPTRSAARWCAARTRPATRSS